MPDLFNESEIAALVQRMELLPQLVRRQQEELILEQVPLPRDWLDQQRREFLGIRALTRFWKPEGGAISISISISSYPRHCVVSLSNVSGRA